MNPKLRLFRAGDFVSGCDEIEIEASSYTTGTGDRVHAAKMAGFDERSTNTLIDTIASEGRTVPGADKNDDAIGTVSNIAGPLPSPVGTCYVKAPQVDTASLPGAIYPYDFYVRVLSGSPIPVPPAKGAPQAPRSNGWGCRVIGTATAKNNTFAITVNGGDTIGVVVGVDLERGAPEWSVFAGIGVFTGFFIITL